MKVMIIAALLLSAGVVALAAYGSTGRVHCRVVPVYLTAEVDGVAYAYTSAAVCSNGGATLSGHVKRVRL